MHTEFNIETIYIDSDKLKLLQSEAALTGININKLVNNIIENYLDYDRIAERVNVLHVRPPFIQSVFSQLSLDTLTKLGKAHGTLGPKSMMDSLRLPFNYDSALILVEEYIGKKFHWFKTDISEKDGVLTINLVHSINKNWSEYLSVFLITMFELFGLSKISKKISDNHIEVVLKKP